MTHFKRHTLNNHREDTFWDLVHFVPKFIFQVGISDTAWHTPRWASSVVWCPCPPPYQALASATQGTSMVSSDQKDTLLLWETSSSSQHHVLVTMPHPRERHRKVTAATNSTSPKAGQSYSQGWFQTGTEKELCLFLGPQNPTLPLIIFFRKRSFLGVENKTNREKERGKEGNRWIDMKLFKSRSSFGYIQTAYLVIFCYLNQSIPSTKAMTG